MSGCTINLIESVLTHPKGEYIVEINYKHTISDNCTLDKPTTSEDDISTMYSKDIGNERVISELSIDHDTIDQTPN